MTESHNYINVAGTVDRSKKPKHLVEKTKKKYDPYAKYDDESANTHYFLVPVTKDPQNFTRDFEELNKINLKCKTPDRVCSRKQSSNGYLNGPNIRPSRSRTKSCSSSPTNKKTPLIRHNSRSTSTSSTTQILNNSSGRLKIPPPPKVNISSTSTTNSEYHSTDDDDYCLIKADTKSTFQPSKHCSQNQYLKREHYPEFNKMLKKNSMVEYAGAETECLKKKKLKNGDDLIDFCTCMVCVRSVSYNYTGNDDGEFIEPCSCQGSTKSVVGRYVCMGLMAIFLPCMLCYLPAKSCCGSNRRWLHNKHKHSQDDTYVHYHSNNNKPL